MGFREILREELDFQGLTVKELAAKSNIVKGTIDCYLNQRATLPNVEIAYKIAQALGVTVEYLVTGKDSKASDTLPEKYKPLKQTLDDLLLLPTEQLVPIQAMIKAAAEMELKKNEKHSEII